MFVMGAAVIALRAVVVTIAFSMVVVASAPASAMAGVTGQTSSISTQTGIQLSGSIVIPSEATITFAPVGRSFLSSQTTRHDEPLNDPSIFRAVSTTSPPTYGPTPTPITATPLTIMQTLAPIVDVGSISPSGFPTKASNPTSESNAPITFAPVLSAGEIAASFNNDFPSLSPDTLFTNLPSAASSLDSTLQEPTRAFESPSTNDSQVNENSSWVTNIPTAEAPSILNATTLFPTEEISEGPSVITTLQQETPSAMPSLATEQPSSKPSVDPSVKLFIELFAEPSMEPSTDSVVGLSNEPSSESFMDHIIESSIEPLSSTLSLDPTIEPSIQSSSGLSMNSADDFLLQPSSEPSMDTSVKISIKPSIDLATDSPEEISNEPSDIPSDVPSDVPSTIPSDLPSIVPTAVLSTQPSDAGEAPSFEPTIPPSILPTSRPSIIPTATPSSMAPSRSASDVPSVSITPTMPAPSVAPSHIPSREPSASPISPSSFPTTSPTLYPSYATYNQTDVPTVGRGEAQLRPSGRTTGSRSPVPKFFSSASTVPPPRWLIGGIPLVLSVLYLL